MTIGSYMQHVTVQLNGKGNFHVFIDTYREKVGKRTTYMKCQIDKLRPQY
jgi:hypothetical protein